MNIREAKEQIQNAMKAYLTKDEFGNYRIPIEKQRPVFLMGPPGVGKTAIMEQVAEELDVALVSYSMTHHTRQSALGLPFITQKMYGGQEYSISEYTMSEIIASVYEMMEATGKKEGILFLDEINCVSETLAPAMLQFLQYKVFGRHKVPEGWIVVTAGNPPEYNNSVREFDIVTWDRLKRVDVEPDYQVWKEFAYKSGVHAAITTYLDIKKTDFYKIETTVDGKSFVTARGWSDLSEMMRLYEEHSIPVDGRLISQYLQNKKIARDFAAYYDLFTKYRSDYQIDRILEGKADKEIYGRAYEAKFDERLSLLGLMLDAVTGEVKEVCRLESVILDVLDGLKKVRAALSSPKGNPAELLEALEKGHLEEIRLKKKASALSADEEYTLRGAVKIFREEKKLLTVSAPADNKEAFQLMKKDYERRVADLKAAADKAGKHLENVFAFCENVFGDGQEMLILVTELTISYYAAHFISRYGCESYFKHNKELLFYERQKEIIRKMEELKLE